MRASRRGFAVSLSIASALVMWAVVGANGQPPGGPDPERAFAFGDTNLDGRLSLPEFRDLIANAARLKNAPAKKAPLPAENIFRRLDADGDGVLNLAEYRKIRQLRQGAAGALGKGMNGPFAKGARVRPEAAKTPAPEASRPATDRPVTADQAKFFETKIRPVLMTKCAKCHSAQADKPKGGLLVDTREGLRKGGDTGPAVVPGDLEQSLLIQAIRYRDEDLKMPPKTPLPAEVVADFEAWVTMGAPDPRGGSTKAVVQKVNREKASQYWAFQPPHASAPAAVKDTSWPRSDVDRFILSALESKGLTPAPDADRPRWLRRVTFDLIGLPPTPEEVEAFEKDTSADAHAKVVDRLLASPRFGERWGRHWLDVARYAETSGKANMIYSNAWRYRDWVIAAFNADMPYDRFVARQVAGDLLPAKGDREKADSVIATGFLAIGSKTHNTQNRKQFVLDLADEQIDATGQTFLGLTIACARCHDHKFDPISQRDYYALSGIFQSTQTCYGTLPGLVQNVNPSPLIELPASASEPTVLPRLTPETRKELEAQLADLEKARDALTTDENFMVKGFQTRARLAMLRFRLASYRPDGTPRAYAMGAQERFEPIDSPLYTRGELEQPAETVPRGLLSALGGGRSATVTHGSGRKELTQWLGSRDNPLTARVMVNRVWLHLFGRGLVASADNFGAAGQPPSHPELLDTLAVQFMDQHWSVKSLIRELALTRTYRQSARQDARAYEVDPDNTLVWRMAPKRLEAEAIRDAVLAVAGTIQLEPPVGSAVAKAGEGLAGPFRGFNRDGQDLHRAVYLAIARDQLPESLTLFDFADPSFVTGDRGTTSGPSQALFLMNSPFVLRQSDAAADRVIAAADTDAARVRAAYLLFYGRVPTPAEQTRALDFVGGFTTGSGGVPSRAAWSALCQALYASAEFRYVD